MADRVPVAVLILNWNGKNVLDECLSSWQNSDPAPATVLVVDNGSADGSVEMVREKYPSVQLLALGENRGFSGGNNAGFRALEGRGFEAVFVCNNDTEVAPDMLGLLWKALEANPSWGIVGPKILFHGTRRVWFLGGYISRLTGNPGHFRYGREDDAAGEPFELGATGFVTGCGLLIRLDLARQLGYFDEKRFSPIYAEDSDLCFRAREAGIASAVVPAVVMTHKVSMTMGVGSPRSMYLITRHSLELVSRHGIGLFPGAWVLTVVVFVAVVCGWRIARTVVQGRFAVSRAIIMGIVDYLARRKSKVV